MNLRAIAFTFGLGCATIPTLLAAETEEPAQSVDKAAREWIAVRTETVRVETEWSREHALLESTVNALKERAARLEEKRDNLKARTADTRGELEQLEARKHDESEAIQQADVRLQKLVARLVAMRASLPPRLSAALEMPYRSLSSSEAGASERMQYALAVLNRCAQFNRSVSCENEIVTIGGAAKSLEVIYWGLSHGYALDRSAGKAWLGSAVAGRWQWEPLDNAAAEVARLIDISRDQANPDFVMVPARVASTVSTR